MSSCASGISPCPEKQLRASFPVEHFCGVRLSGCEGRGAADKRHGVAVWPRAPRGAPAMVKAGRAGYSRSLVQTLEVRDNGRTAMRIGRRLVWVLRPMFRKTGTVTPPTILPTPTSLGAGR